MPCRSTNDCRPGCTPRPATSSSRCSRSPTQASTCATGVLCDALTARLTWAVVVGLVIGKLLGIGLASWAGVRTGAGRLPTGVGFGQVLGGAALSGIGFTVSLLIAGLAFTDRALHDQAVVGILIAAVLATLLGWAVFRAASVGQTDADLPEPRPTRSTQHVDHVRGPLDAPLTLVEYGEYECPFCARTTGVAARASRTLRRPAPLRVPPPPAGRRPPARRARRPGRGRRPGPRTLLGDARPPVRPPGPARARGPGGVRRRSSASTSSRFLRDLEHEDTAAKVRADVASAEASGARGTPTFFVGDRRHAGPHDTETLAHALESSRQASVLPPRRRTSG